MDIHRPTERQTFFFFLVVILVCIGILGWVFFLNKGYVLVSGPTPFNIKTAGVDSVCQSSPCKVVLGPRSYEFTFTKEGYFAETREINVERGKQVAVDVTFNIVPHVEKVTPPGRVSGFTPLWPPYIGATTLENYPEQAKSGIFSASGGFALLNIGREVYLYDNSQTSLAKTSISANTPVTISGEKVVVLSTKENKPALELWSADKENTLLASFERAFENPVLHGDVLGNFVLIEEALSQGPKWYLVDINTLSRRGLNLEGAVRFIRWIPAGMVFERDIGGDTTVFILDQQNQETVMPYATHGMAVTQMKDGSIIYVSERAPGENAPATGITITEAIDRAVEERTDETPISVWYIVRRTSDGREYALARILNTFSPITKVDVDPKTDTLYFFQDDIYTLVTM